MTSASDLEVPVAWFWAEHLAEDLIASSGSAWPLIGFEAQAARTVLALTLLFTGVAEHASQVSDEELQLIRDLISSGGAWLDWCDLRIDAADTPASCLQLARRAFRWLLLVAPFTGEETEKRPGTGCRVGLKHARKAVHARLAWPS